ncbi:MAG: hypothetical protein OXC95_14060, partial [Dehalococcoidia bacterium]|nr:hypothetical protein [Dehalococcoidia bacterium]
VGVHSALPISAQSVPVELTMTVEKVDKTESEDIYVGDPFIITLSATYPPDYFVIFPQVPSQWSDEFEVRSQSSQPTTQNEDGTNTSSIQIEAVLFSTGDIPTPELSVAIRKPDGEIVNRPVKPVDVVVARFLPEANDNELKDIKPQAELPVPLDPLSALRDREGLAILAVLGGVGLAALAVYLWGLMRAPAYPELGTPAETAIAELDRILALPLESDPDFKERYTLVSDCLRNYLWGQFSIPALELTTQQILRSINSSEVSIPEIDGLARILDECDLVKFARFLPDEDDAISVIEQSREFILRTGAVPDPEDEPVTVGAEPA